MLFNSIDFAIFLPVVFVLYWFLTGSSLKAQNLLLVAASYFFYGWWDWRFLGLLLFLTIANYFLGLQLSQQTDETRRKGLFYAGLLVNLGVLAFFKYFNFFQNNFVAAFSLFGVEINAGTLNIILPIGISFYTFKTLSYLIDVYKRTAEPAVDFVAYAGFVAFFPQLVAGPIDRANTLLPQFYRERIFEYGKAVDGSRQILWGLFKKMVVADNCARMADLFFNNSSQYPGSLLVLGTFFFAFQIYGDFSGYSDISIGVSKLLGFNVMKNFAFPYFSRDVAEFWRRWHISLSNWLRDYVFYPLRRKLMQQKTLPAGRVLPLPVFVTMLVSGLWHGANWTFIVWGALHGVFLILEGSLKPSVDKFIGRFNSKTVSGLYYIFQILFTFTLICFGWIFFRAENMAHAMGILAEIFSSSLFSVFLFPEWKDALAVLLVVAGLVFIEWLGRDAQYAIETLGWKWPRPVRWAFYSAMIFLIGMLMETSGTPFIYTQF